MGTAKRFKESFNFFGFDQSHVLPRFILAPEVAVAANAGASAELDRLLRDLRSARRRTRVDAFNDHSAFLVPPNERVTRGGRMCGRSPRRARRPPPGAACSSAAHACRIHDLDVLGTKPCVLGQPCKHARP